MCFILNGCPLVQPQDTAPSPKPGHRSPNETALARFPLKHSREEPGGQASPSAHCLGGNGSLILPASPSHRMSPQPLPPSSVAFPRRARCHSPLPSPPPGFGPGLESPSSFAKRFLASRECPCSPSGTRAHSRGPVPCARRRSSAMCRTSRSRSSRRQRPANRLRRISLHRTECRILPHGTAPPPYSLRPLPVCVNQRRGRLP